MSLLYLSSPVTRTRFLHDEKKGDELYMRYTMLLLMIAD